MNPEVGDSKETSGTILLCDDDFFVVDITGRILRKCNFKVLPSLNARDCLDIFEDNKEKIDLVMLDIDLPEMNGMEVARIINSIMPSVPVLFFSGFTINACRERFDITENIEILEKPFREKELRKKIMALLNRDIC